MSYEKHIEEQTKLNDQQPIKGALAKKVSEGTELLPFMALAGVVSEAIAQPSTGVIVGGVVIGLPIGLASVSFMRNLTQKAEDKFFPNGVLPETVTKTARGLLVGGACSLGAYFLTKDTAPDYFSLPLLWGGAMSVGAFLNDAAQRMGWDGMLHIEKKDKKPKMK